MLLANGTVIPDSTAILNWLEKDQPDPTLTRVSAKKKKMKRYGLR